MNIFHKVALQGLKKNRTRTMVTIVGVALSAALITAVSTFAVSLQSYMVKGAIEKYGGWHAAFWDVSNAFVQEQAAAKEVEKSAVVKNIGYAKLDGCETLEKPYLFLAGYSQEAFDMLPTALYSGRLPENSGEAVITEKLALEGGVKWEVGDTIDLTVGKRMKDGSELGQNQTYDKNETFVPKTKKSYKIVGTCKSPVFAGSDTPGYALLTKGDEKDRAGDFMEFVTLKDPRQLQDYLSEAGEEKEYILNDDVLRFLGLSENNLFNGLLYAIGGIVIAIIMVGSIFLIYNSFHISLNQRTHQFGILMSVGATEKQLRNSVLFEGICVGAVGIPIGILIGIPSIKAVLALVEKNFNNIMYDNVPLTLEVSLPAIAAAAGISLITILISAYIPAKKAAKTPVMDCIRQTGEIKLEAKTVKTSQLTSRLCGLEGMLATKSFKRNKRRYRSIVLSLTLSVILFVSANAFSGSLDQMSKQSVVEADGDILLYSQELGEEKMLRFYDSLKNAQAVTDSTYQTLATGTCKVAVKELTQAFREECLKDAETEENAETIELVMDIQFIEDDIYEKFVKEQGLPIEEYTGKNAKTIVVGKFPGNKDIFNSRSMDFTIETESGKQTKTLQNATLLDTYPLDPPPANGSQVKNYVLIVQVPYGMKAQYDALNAPEQQELIFWSKDSVRSTADIREMLKGTGVTEAYTLYNVSEMLETNKNLTFIIDLFTLVFVVMISLIAVANVFNTISTNIKLRRRELAMLRSVGMSDRAFNKMMRFECVLYGARTMLWGLPLSVLLSWLIHKGVVAGGGQIQFQLPWGSMGISLLGVFLVIFITMLYTTRKIKQENIIDALRDDMA